MTNTSRLYFHSPDSGAPPVVIARDYCGWESMPFLWRLLLAEGTPGSPLAISTAGEPATGSVQVSALDAIDKLRFFADYIAGHPLLHRLPELPVFLDGVLVFLRERLAQFPARDAAKVLLVAQDKEGGLPDPGLMQDIEVEWIDIQIFADENTYHGLDEVLGFADSRYSFERWEAWPGLFGLDTLEHAYFSRLEYSLYWDKYLPPPDAMPYKQFVRSGGRSSAYDIPDQTEDPQTSAWSMLKGMVKSLLQPAPPADEDPEEEEEDEDDEDEDEHENAPWLHEAFQPVIIDGKVGLRFDVEHSVDYHTELDGPDEDPDTLALAAEWDEIIPDYSTRAWVRRDGLWGVVDLRRHCTILMAPCADRLDFGSGDRRPYAMKDGLCGLIDTETGTWSLPPEYDEMVWCQEACESTWQVRKGAYWGVVNGQGQLKQPCIYESMMIDDSGDYQLRDHGWKVLRNGRAGWVTFAGELDVACEWDDVKPFVPERLYTAARDGRWGFIAGGNQQWIPCDYLGVEPLALARHVRQSKPGRMWWYPHDFWESEHDVPAAVAECDPALSNLLIAVRTEGGTGVVDQAQRQLVPCMYKAIAPAQSGDYHDARWLRVTAHDGRQGLWCVASGSEIFACKHEWLDVFAGPRIGQPLVGTMDGERYRLWNLDGTPAFDASFLWLSAGDWNHDRDIEEGVGDFERGKIAKNWRRGQAVRAAQEVAGEARLVCVLPGHPIMSEQQSLEQAYMASGDREAALKLAKGHQDGFHQVQDLELARLWAARACGHVPAPAMTSPRSYPPYCFEKPVEEIETEEAGPDDDETDEEAAESAPAPAYDENYEEPECDTDEPDEQDKDLYEDAAYLFARMLDEGVGGPRDAALALHWIHGAAYGTGVEYNTHAPTWLLLGKLLLDEAAGPVDVPEAYRVLSHINAPSLDEGEACFYRACCLRRGMQGVPDLQGARELMVRADASGVALAAPALAEMLADMAATAEPTKAPLLKREAAYYAQKAKAAAEKAATQE